jgi:replicative DNA helicase
MNNLHNINIERAILSTIIFEPSIFEDIVATLKSEDFYLPFHKVLFETMVELERDDKPIDEEFLKKELEKKKRFDEDSFFEILGTAPLSNISAYLGEVKDKAIKRELVKLTTQIKDIAIQQDLPSEDVLDIVQKKLYEISLDVTTKEFRDSLEITKTTIEHILAMKEKGNTGVIGVDTGFRELNFLTSGFTPGQLIIIAARPAMGKTAFTLNLAQKALDDGRGVAIFSLEMPAEELMLRMLSAKTSIPLQNLKVGNLTDEEWTNLTRATDELSKKKFFVDDDGLININQVRSKLRKLKSQHPEIELAIIDYLQLMSGTGNKDRHQEVSEISRGLKLLARELELPIIALSQLNRGLEARSDKRPMLSDLRESGAIEQDADIILFVYRDDVYRIREEKEKEKKAKAEGKEYKSDFFEKPQEEAEIIVGKNRNGPTGIANLLFQKAFTRFVNNGGATIEVIYKNAEVDAKNSKIELSTI